MECPKCGGSLYIIKDLTTDNRDGIRLDRYCPRCHIRYGLKAYGLVVITKPEIPGECKFKSPCIFYKPEKKEL